MLQVPFGHIIYDLLYVSEWIQFCMLMNVMKYCKWHVCIMMCINKDYYKKICMYIKEYIFTVSNAFWWLEMYFWYGNYCLTIMWKSHVGVKIKYNLHIFNIFLYISSLLYIVLSFYYLITCLCFKKSTHTHHLPCLRR